MNPTPDAVYYTTSDYAHPARRIGAALVDFVVLFLVVWQFSTGVALLVALPDVKRLSNTPEGQKQVDRQETKTQIKKSMKSIQVPAGLVAFVLLPAAYHIGLRRLRGGTPGYRVMGIRVVDRTGSTPGWRVLLRRFLIGTPMVLLLGAGYWQCPRDPKRQANHDRWSGTWVVRKKAEPAGPALTAYQTKLFGIYPLTYIDVEPAPATVVDAEAGETDNPPGNEKPEDHPRTEYREDSEEPIKR